jgi:hypothetical protein
MKEGLKRFPLYSSQNPYYGLPHGYAYSLDSGAFQRRKQKMPPKGYTDPLEGFHIRSF